MLTPTHAKKSFTAKRVFTDREDARDLFSAAIGEVETQESYKVLMWYGIGGQGKSALLREFGRMTKAFNEAEAEKKSGKILIPAKIDFDDERLKRIDAALYSIRLQLAQTSGFSFHTFDTAFIAYYKKTRPGIDIATAFPELFKGEREGMMDLIDVLDGPLSLVTDLASAALPGANLLYKWGARLTGKLASWWKSRGNEILSDIEQLQPEQLLERLPSYLGIDLCDNIKTKPKLRPVILLDTYEALWRDRGQKDGLADRRTDAWVRLLVQDAPGVLFVIAGRDKLRWGEIDEAWNSVIDAHLLGDLSDEDAERFLLDVPITEPDVREKIVSSSNGLPFYLDLQVSLYEALREQDKAPVAEQFGGTPSDILARFLEHLSEADQGALRLASYLQIVTRPVMDDLAEAFPGRAINYSFEQMVSRSSFVEISEGTFEIHALMKEELQLREKTENEGSFRGIHTHLYKGYDERLGAERDFSHRVQEDDVNFCLHHVLEAQSYMILDWILRRRDQIFLSGHWEVLGNCYLRAIEVIKDRPTENSDILPSLVNNLACTIESQGSHTDARQLFDESVDLHKRFFGEDDLRTICTQYNSAQNFAVLGEFETAIESMKNVRNSAERTMRPDHPYLSNIDNDIGFLYQKSGRIKEAEVILWRSLGDIITEIQPSISQILSLSTFSENLHSQARHQEAELLHRLASQKLSKLLFFEDTSTEIAVGREIELFQEATKNMDVREILGNVSEIYRKVGYDPFPRILSEPIRNSVVDFSEGGSGYEIHHDDIWLRKPNYDDVFKNKAEYHSEAEKIVKAIEGCIQEFDLDSKIIPFLKRAGVKIVIFQANHFDCYYCHRANILVFGVSRMETVDVHAVGVIAFSNAYLAVVHHAGLLPPAFRSGRMAFAEYQHGVNLDIMVKIADFIIRREPSSKESYLDVMSENMKLFIEKRFNGASRDDLYSAYSEAFELRLLSS